MNNIEITDLSYDESIEIEGGIAGDAAFQIGRFSAILAKALVTGGSSLGGSIGSLF